MTHKAWFVLPPVQEWYYKSKSPSYRSLPSFASGCNSDDDATPMELIYPKELTKIYVPYELDGKSGKTVFEVAHRKANTTIYWHVGGREALVTAVIEKMAQLQADFEVMGDTPHDRVLLIASRIWDNAHTHRNVTSLAHRTGSTGRLELPLQIAMVQEFEAAGVRGAKARDALRATMMCIAGFLVVALRQPRAQRERKDLDDDLESVDLWESVPSETVSSATRSALGKPAKLRPLFLITVSAVINDYLTRTDRNEAETLNQEKQ